MAKALSRATYVWPFFVCALAMWIGGCTKSVTIVQPLDGTYTSPVTPLTVKFHPEFKPGTFQANLSGTNITSLFHPTPAAGGTSTAEIVYPPSFMDADYSGNVQRLVVDGDFTTPTGGLGNRVTPDSSNFTPPSFRIFRGRTSFDPVLTLKERETITATAFVDQAPKEGLRVTITGNSLVSLNDQPAGQDIQVVIMPNDRRADFTVRGIQAGGEVFVIRGIATGYSSATARGLVQANQ